LGPREPVVEASGGWWPTKSAKPTKDRGQRTSSERSRVLKGEYMNECLCEK